MTDDLRVEKVLTEEQIDAIYDALPKHPLMLAYSNPLLRWYPSVGMVDGAASGIEVAEPLKPEGVQP